MTTTTAPGPSVVDTIGGTPLVQLQHIVPAGSADVVVKIESVNPTGSMKDRMALAMIETAEAAGHLRPGSEVIEATGGSTGTSLALICAVKGYRLSIVTSDAISEEKRNHMRALGAALTVLKSEGGQLTKALFDRMIDTTKTIVRERGAFWTNQFENESQATGYYRLADELWVQTRGRVTAFVQVVGTGGSIRGTATRLRDHRQDIRVVAVEPTTSAVLSGAEPGGHRIEGVGIGRIPHLWNPDLVDEIQTVTTEEAEAMARRLAREEAIFAGTSSGANVVVALRVAERLGPGATVATLAIDSGLKYLSTPLYKT